MVKKKSEKTKKIQNIQKKYFFAEKNDILLFFQYSEDAIQPELSGQAYCKVRAGGYPERDGAAAAGVVAGLYFPFLI